MLSISVLNRKHVTLLELNVPFDPTINMASFDKARHTNLYTNICLSPVSCTHQV